MALLNALLMTTEQLVDDNRSTEQDDNLIAYLYTTYALVGDNRHLLDLDVDDNTLQCTDERIAVEGNNVWLYHNQLVDDNNRQHTWE